MPQVGVPGQLGEVWIELVKTSACAKKCRFSQTTVNKGGVASVEKERIGAERRQRRTKKKGSYGPFDGDFEMPGGPLFQKKKTVSLPRKGTVEGSARKTRTRLRKSGRLQRRS